MSDEVIAAQPSCEVLMERQSCAKLTQRAYVAVRPWLNMTGIA